MQKGKRKKILFNFFHSRSWNLTWHFFVKWTISSSSPDLHFSMCGLNMQFILSLASAEMRNKSLHSKKKKKNNTSRERCSLLRSVTRYLLTGSAVSLYVSLTKKRVRNSWNRDFPPQRISKAGFLELHAASRQNHLFCSVKLYNLDATPVPFCPTGDAIMQFQRSFWRKTTCADEDDDGSPSAWSTSRLRKPASSVRIQLKTVSSVFRVACWSLNWTAQDGPEVFMQQNVSHYRTGKSHSLSTEPLALPYFKPVIKSCGCGGCSCHACCLSGWHHFLRFLLKLEMQSEACLLRPNSEELGHFAWIKRICHRGLEQQSALNRSESICCDDGWRAMKSPGKILLAVCHQVSVQQQFNISPMFSFVFFFLQ